MSRMTTRAANCKDDADQDWKLLGMVKLNLEERKEDEEELERIPP